MGNNTQYSWKEFHDKSDKAYEQALQGNHTAIANHNITKDGEDELLFYLQFTSLNLSNSQKTALDICCGSGYMSNELQKLGFETIGIDISETGIALANKTYPCCSFIHGDATKPSSLVDGSKFDLILVREAHPFSRIDDLDFQKVILDDYIKLLAPKGAIIICHARHGGNMSFPSINYDRLSNWLSNNNCSYHGPHYYFLFKHLKLPIISKTFVTIVTKFTKLLAKATNQRWIEFFVITKN